MAFRTLTLALVAALTLPAPALAAPGGIEGLWRNGRDSVRIRTHACGTAICATVVQADAKAQADAARGGTPKLVGTQVFRNFQPSRKGVWKGRVYVPDLDRTFSGVLSVAPDDRLVGKGCILGGLICKSTAWYRVK